MEIPRYLGMDPTRYMYSSGTGSGIICSVDTPGHREWMSGFKRIVPDARLWWFRNFPLNVRIYVFMDIVPCWRGSSA